MTQPEPKFHPKTDGVDHINIYSRGRTPLGQALSNFAHTPFEHPKDGKFASKVHTAAPNWSLRWPMTTWTASVPMNWCTASARWILWVNPRTINRPAQQRNDCSSRNG